MKSETVTIQTIFQDRRQYSVPFYQRAYVWTWKINGNSYGMTSATRPKHDSLAAKRRRISWAQGTRSPGPRRPDWR